MDTFMPTILCLIIGKKLVIIFFVGHSDVSLFKTYIKRTFEVGNGTESAHGYKLVLGIRGLLEIYANFVTLFSFISEEVVSWFLVPG